MIRTFASVRAIALTIAIAGCSPKMQWDTRTASSFNPSGHAVSVFGVYKDGQMSSDAWAELRPRLEPVLGGRCAIAHDGPLGDDPVFTAVDEYARANGPTDDLLAQLAPAAQGDLILVFVEGGRLPAPDAKVSVVDAPATKGPSPGGGQGAAGLAAFAPSLHGDRDRDVLQLSASVFSIKEKRSVASIDLQYSGQSVDEAEREFTAGLARLLPAATCKGWDWHAPVDAEGIRKLAVE